ncbi:MAG: alpha-galactosidase [Leifsonia xyli]|nr:MAG: alpha-galactosidase [Leifsonia xyli]
MTRIRWRVGEAELVFAAEADAPVQLVEIALGDARHPVNPVPVASVLTVERGHAAASRRLTHTVDGAVLRYAGHRERAAERTRSLEIDQTAPGLGVRIVLEAIGHAAAFRARATVTNTGDATLVLRAVPSWSSGLPAGAPDDAVAGWELVHGRSDWLGEGRWERRALRDGPLPRLAAELTGHRPRGGVTASSTGTWSTADELPTGMLVAEQAGIGIAWQIEHNGSWSWEVGEEGGGASLSLSGPSDQHGAWTQPLAPGESFETVPTSLAFGAGFTEAIAALTDHRRAIRHPEPGAPPVVFNDYMNTLNGDPSTERLLPLVAAAAEVGAEVFCIDAGWYDDTGDWWDSVGEWLPSRGRFPGGLGEVTDAIRRVGMVPGLWLEPEVVGVHSPVAELLPSEAFLQRHGARIVEHGRYHLDLRHPAARAHLDGVVDRLVAEFGIGYLKLDYNIDPGPGTDRDAPSVGAGLLAHNRAHLDWLDGLRERHPRLLVENCASGAMRMDAAMLARVTLQSTSDQQDPTKYPPIAAAAPLSLPPEQAADWAYPQPGMSPEMASFCLVTGLLGSLYLSGHLDRMTPAERARVADAVAVARALAPLVRSGHPHWPLGLPGWDDPWVALALRSPEEEEEVLAVWHRGGPASAALSLPHRRGRELHLETLFPRDLPAWESTWDPAAGVLHLHAAAAHPAARLIRLAP